MKIYKYALLILGYSLFAQSVFAQYDTYGRSQATREWQAYEAHHANMYGNNKSTSSSSSSGTSTGYKGTYEPFDFSRYKTKPLTLEEIAANQKYRQEQREREKREEQIKKEKDAAWQRELNKFKIASATGNDKSYSFNTRLEAFNLLLRLTDSLNKSMKGGIYKQPQSSFNNIHYLIGRLYMEYKNFNQASYYFNKAQYDYLNPKEPISYITTDYIYSLLLGSNNYEYASEQSAKLYKKDYTAVNHFAYALFLNKQLNSAVKIFQQEIDKKPAVHTDTTVTRFLTRIVAMEFIQGNNAAAMAVVNKYFDDKLTNEDKAKEIVAGLLAKNIDLMDSTYKSIKPVSMYFDLDLLCKLFPGNTKAAQMRYDFGVETDNIEKQKSINVLWDGVTQIENKDYSIDGYLSRASYDKDLAWAKERLANYSHKKELPDIKTYETELEEFRKFFRTMTNYNKEVEVKDGLLILYYSVYRPLYIVIENLRIEYSSYSNSVILKGIIFDSHEPLVIREKYLSGDEKTKPRASELLYSLVKKLQKESKKRKGK